MRCARDTRLRIELNLGVNYSPGRRHNTSDGYKCRVKTKYLLSLIVSESAVLVENASVLRVDDDSGAAPLAVGIFFQLEGNSVVDAVE